MEAKPSFTVSSLSDFLQKEVRHEDFYLKRLIDGDIEKNLVTGEILGPLKASNKEISGLVLRGQAFFSRFRPGDQVDVGTLDPKSKKLRTLSGTNIKLVRFPEPGVIEVLIPGKMIPLDDSMELFLIPQSHSGIKKFLRQKLAELERFNFKAEHFPINNRAVHNNFNKVSEELNGTQKEALKFLIDNDFKGLVQGPPGTGKTYLLESLVTLAIESGLRVGLAALSHAALDNALARVLQKGIDPEGVVRLASNKQKIRVEPYGGYDIHSLWTRSFKELEEEYRLYATGIHSWCLTNSPPKIDLLIIDEASQVPIYFYPFLSKLCSRIIMFGDHKQLPPVIQLPEHDLPAEDIFSYQIARGKYPMLETQYRMNEGVQEWSSNKFYHGQLKPHDSNRHRDVLKGLPSASGLLGHKVVNLIQHDGRSTNNANTVEAKKVADLVWALKAEGKIPLHEIGIVTPHRAQAGAICAQLQEKLGLDKLQNILVDTVERFQGQEREAMIFSMGAENEVARRGDRVFLGDGRRLNVAVTRAKSRFYCLAPQRLIQSAANFHHNSILFSFLNWCGNLHESQNQDSA